MHWGPILGWLARVSLLGCAVDVSGRGTGSSPIRCSLFAAKAVMTDEVVAVERDVS